MPNYVCPRCGALGYIERRYVNGQAYYYCRHVTIENKQRKEKRCYLGARQYSYVEAFNRMQLAGMLDEERFRRYLEYIIPKLRVEDLIILKERIEKELARLERGRAITANSPSQD
jgi:hypothetical protein